MQLFRSFSLLVLFTGLVVVSTWHRLSAQAVDVSLVSITVSNLDRSVAFYTQTLSFTENSRAEIQDASIDALFGCFGTSFRAATLSLGAERIQLIEFITPSNGRPIPPDSRSTDGWFQHIAIVVRDMPTAYDRLRAAGVVHISMAPQTLPAWNHNAAGIKAFYFKDPDGHVLELIYFPAGKGQPRWQSNTSTVFLGIDHTAIGVGDTPTSLAFYKQTLGLSLGGQGVNYGPEQALLNHVEDAHVRITGMRAPHGIGIEFLDYLYPRRQARAYPTDSRVTDRWHWHTSIRVTDLENTVRAAESAGAIRLSTSTKVTLSDAAKKLLGVSSAVVLRDPDGHALLLGE